MLYCRFYISQYFTLYSTPCVLRVAQGIYLCSVLFVRRCLATMRYCVLSFRMHSWKHHVWMTSLTWHNQWVPSCRLWHLRLVTLGSKESRQIHGSVPSTELFQEWCDIALLLVRKQLCFLWAKVKKRYLAVCGKTGDPPTTEFQSVTCHPAQVNVLNLNPSQAQGDLEVITQSPILIVIISWEPERELNTALFHKSDAKPSCR